MLCDRHKGQSIVELAFISLIAVSLLVATIDVSRAFSAHLTLGNMARAGAQAGSVSAVLGAETTGEAKALIENGAKDEDSLLLGGEPTVESRLCVDSADYKLVQVRVSYEFEPLVGIGPLAGPFTLERQVEMRAQMTDMRSEFTESCF